MSDGFVKIYGKKLLSSSLWDQPMHVRLAFIGMLADADMSGIVQKATVGGLARMLNLTVEQTQDALAVLEAPDPESRTPNDDGRRVRRVPGGWQMVNHTDHRDYRSQKQEDERLRKAAERAREKPDKSGLVQDASGTSCDTESRSQITEDRGKSKGENPPNPPGADERLRVVEAVPANTQHDLPHLRNADDPPPANPGAWQLVHTALKAAYPGEMPEFTGRQQRSTTDFVLKLSRKYGRAIEQVAKDVCAAAKPGTGYWRANTATVDPYVVAAPPARASPGNRIPSSPGTTGKDFENEPDLAHSRRIARGEIR